MIEKNLVFSRLYFVLIGRILKSKEIKILFVWLKISE